MAKCYLNVFIYNHFISIKNITIKGVTYIKNLLGIVAIIKIKHKPKIDINKLSLIILITPYYIFKSS